MPTPSRKDYEKYHRAVLDVYAAIDVLVELMPDNPNEQRVGLIHLDEVNRLREPREKGDSEWMGNLKTAASQLRAATATAITIVNAGTDLRLGRVYGQVSGGGHTWGPISCVSCHLVAIGAANAMLETGNVMTELVLRSAKDPRQWDQLKNDLASEQERVLLVLGPEDKPGRKKPARRGSPRPTPEVIDTTALQYLTGALAAGQEAGEAFVPTRKDIAHAVSKSLKYDIKVASLFGTKKSGEARVHRYPKFIELWQKTQRLSTASRPRSGDDIRHR